MTWSFFSRTLVANSRVKDYMPVPLVFLCRDAVSAVQQGLRDKFLGKSLACVYHVSKQILICMGSAV